MHKIEVGELYLKGKTSYPSGVEFNFSRIGYELRLFYDRPSKAEIKAIKKGAAQFKLLIHEKIIFLLYKFNPLPWGDAPYSWWAVPLNYRIEPEKITKGTKILLQIILIDSTTGIVKAIRVKTLETELSQKLYAAIKEQMSQKISNRDYENSVNRAYVKYANTSDMVKATLN
jgi:hypothetical protein